MARRRDPRRPRRPTSAYFLWMSQNRDRLKRLHPQMNVLDLMREASSQWRALSAQEKRPWEDAAAAARRRFISIFGWLGYRRRPRNRPLNRPFMGNRPGMIVRRPAVGFVGVARPPVVNVRNAPPATLRPPQPAAPANNNAPPISIVVPGTPSTAASGSALTPTPASTASAASGSTPAP